MATADGLKREPFHVQQVIRMMFLQGKWVMPGVHNVEEFNPDPFLEQLAKDGLPWHEIVDGDIELEA